jgi:hypothetical protein
MDLVIVKLEKPYKGCICYVSHFTSKVFDRKGGQVLVDAPVSFDGTRERRWVPKENVWPV